MKPRALASVMLFGVALAGCGGAQSRPVAVAQLDREASGPVAREAQRDAPDAYAEFARALHAAEQAASGPALAMQNRVVDAHLTLAWAATEARSNRARARIREADARREQAESEAARLERDAAAVEREIAERTTSAHDAVRARTAATTPSSVSPIDRLEVAAMIRQQTELDLAAAALLGADPAVRAPVETLNHSADLAAHGNDPTAALVAAGRAFTAAEALLREVRQGHAAPPDATNGEQLVTDLSQTGGFEPRRDERGVVAVMRGLFGSGATLTPASRGRIDTIARVIQSHLDAHVRVEAFVGGADRSRAERNALAQAQAVVHALVERGVPQARLESAGVYRLPNGPRSADEINVVMVTPAEP